MEQNIIDLYNPANAKNLTAEQLAAMANFSNEDLKALATAYPNINAGNAYLVIGNTKLKTQIGSRSTFANLYALRVKNQQKQFYALSYTSVWKRAKPAATTTASLTDITEDEISNLPGVKKLAKNVVAKAVKGKAKEQTAKLTDGGKAKNDPAEKSITVDEASEIEFPDLTEDAAAKANGEEK